MQSAMAYAAHSAKLTAYNNYQQLHPLGLLSLESMAK